MTTPGTTPTEEALRRLLNDVRPESVTLGDLSAIRRLMFDAQTLSVAMVKQAVEGNDGQTKSELSPPERSHRIADQKTRLVMVYSLFLPCAQVLMYSSIAVHVSLHKPELLM